MKSFFLFIKMQYLKVALPIGVIGLFIPLLGESSVGEARLAKQMQCSHLFLQPSFKIEKSVLEKIDLSKFNSLVSFHAEKMLNPESTQGRPKPSENSAVRDDLNRDEFETALAKAINSQLDTALESNGQFDYELVHGHFRPSIILSIHSHKESQVRSMEYLKSWGILDTTPWVQLYGINNFTNGLNEASAKASVLRVSYGGELRGLNLNTPLLHVFGGSLGGCLTVGMKDAAHIILNHRERDSLRMIVHSRISYGLSTNESIDQQMLRISSNSLERYVSSLNKFHSPLSGRGEFELLSARKVGNDEHYEISLKRIMDQKVLIIEFVTDPL